MRLALDEARKAAALGEVPVGAVAVCDGVVVASGYNLVETAKNASAHAEMLLMNQLSAQIGDWRLDRFTIYVTKEPCPMCAGAMVNGHLKALVFAMPDPRFGAAGSAMNITMHPDSLWQVQTTSGILAEEATVVFKEFFAKIRKDRREQKKQSENGSGGE